MRSRRLLLLAFLLLDLVPTFAQAQVLRGKITDRITGDAVSSATVVVLNADSTVRGTALTDMRGDFTVRPAPGPFILYVERLGYHSVWTRQLELAGSDSLTFAIRLPPEPIDLAALEVVAPTRGELDPSGFHQRQALGWGRFIGPEEVDRRKPTIVTDLLQHIPGLRFIPSRGGGYLVRMEGRGRYCSPTVYLDRGLVARGTATPGGLRPESIRKAAVGVELDALINARLVRAVEVYQTPGEAPPGFHATGEHGQGDCGVLVLWTFAGFGN